MKIKLWWILKRSAPTLVWTSVMSWRVIQWKIDSKADGWSAKTKLDVVTEILKYCCLAWTKYCHLG